MTDFERRLRDSLKSVGEGYRPADPYAAKQEFFRRRRRRRVGVWAGGAVTVGAAAAAAFVAFATLGPGEDTVRPTAPTVTPGMSEDQPDVEAIRIGDTPDGISVGGGYAWAVDSGSHELVRIDPVDNSSDSIDIGAKKPEDVLAAHGAVWVTDTESIIRYDPATGGHKRTRLTGTDAFDLAIGEDDDIWALDIGGDLYQIAAASGDVVNTWSVGGDVVDVTTSGPEVWLYDREAGEVIAWDPALEQITARANVGSSGGSDDLVAGLRHVWFFRGTDGRLLQINKEDERIVKRFDLGGGGSFAGLSIDKGTLWAMVNEGNGEGNLYQIDVDSSHEIAEPIPVTDTPFDVAAGYGSVWVTNNDTGEVTRVSFGEDTAPSSGPPQVVFYYSDGNDIWGYQSDSQSVTVTQTPEPELSPTISSDGQSLVFQRGDGTESEAPRIVRLDLDSGAEADLGAGFAPAYGPDGRVAFAVPGAPGHESTGVMIVDSEGGSDFVPFPSALAPIQRIAWDFSYGVLYFQTSGEQAQSYAMDLAAARPRPLVTLDTEGTVLTSPSMELPGVLTAVELCCTPGRFTRSTLWRLAGGPTVDWTPFQQVAALDDIFTGGASPQTFAVPAGSLDFDRNAGWTTTEYRAWFVGDGDEVWLIDDSFVGVNERMPLTGVQAIAVNPLFLNE